MEKEVHVCITHYVCCNDSNNVCFRWRFYKDTLNSDQHVTYFIFSTAAIIGTLSVRDADALDDVTLEFVDGMDAEGRLTMFNTRCSTLSVNMYLYNPYDHNKKHYFSLLILWYVYTCSYLWNITFNYIYIIQISCPWYAVISK